MGKYMRKNRTADVAVMEGSLGVRTRARTLALEQARKHSLRKTPGIPQPMDASYMELRNRKLAKKLKSRDGDEGCKAGVQKAETANQTSWNSRMEVAEVESSARLLEEETSQNSLPQQQTASNTSSCVEEEVSLQACPRAAASRLLRESHSDSCLRRQAPIAVAHSRSNSASFTHEQTRAMLFGFDGEARGEAEVDIQRVSPEISTKEIEASCGDNAVVVLANESQASYIYEGFSVSTPTDQERVAEAPTPGSSSRYSHHRRSAADCGPAWRHRVGNAPTTDEIEDFFSGVEEDDRKRFVDKYNFDIFNDVPLPGRFEWVRFQA